MLFEILSAQNFIEYPQTPPFEGLIINSVAFADIDADNDQDLLITGTGMGFFSKLYTNDGMGIFTEVTATPFNGIIIGETAFVDIDGDNDKDVFITGLSSSSVGQISKLYKNDGAGIFTEVTGTPFTPINAGSVAFADVDGDSDQDVLITGVVNSGEPGISKLYFNDGTGIFTELTPSPFEGVTESSIAFADVDGDNDQDVLITGQNSSFNLVSKLYTNDGTGMFTEMTENSFQGVSDGSIAFADIDGDNDQDLIITGRNSSQTGISMLYTNNGVGVFSQVVPSPFKGVGFSSIALTDVDNDNDQDVLISGLNGTGNRISELYINDGMGTFSQLPDTPFEGVMESSVAFADIDSDNDQDLLIVGQNASASSIAKLYLNDGIISSLDNSLANASLNIFSFPNPVTVNKLNIRFNSKENNSIILRVLDLNGKLMLKQKNFTIAGEQILEIDIDALPSGSYIVQLDDGEKISTTKFVIP